MVMPSGDDNEAGPRIQTRSLLDYAAPVMPEQRRQCYACKREGRVVYPMPTSFENACGGGAGGGGDGRGSSPELSKATTM